MKKSEYMAQRHRHWVVPNRSREVITTKVAQDVEAAEAAGVQWDPILRLSEERS